MQRHLSGGCSQLSRVSRTGLGECRNRDGKLTRGNAKCPPSLCDGQAEQAGDERARPERRRASSAAGGPPAVTGPVAGPHVEMLDDKNEDRVRSRPAPRWPLFGQRGPGLLIR